MPIRKQTQKHLNELQQILQEQAFWQSIPPSEQALQSTQPFAIDTLTATEWLQWIFIPRMTALIEGGHSLPNQIAISPYIEEALKEEVGLASLLRPIIAIEELLKSQC